MTAADWISARRALLDAAAEGPWEAPEKILGLPSSTVFGPNGKHVLYQSCDSGTSAFVADSRTSLPLALDALEAVLEMHTATNDGYHCRHDGWGWPCPTVAAIEIALAGDPR